MRLEVTAHDLPERVSDLHLEVRVVDASEADAPARDIVEKFSTPVQFPAGTNNKTLPVAIPDPETAPRRPASLLVRLTGQGAGDRQILYLNTSEIIVPDQPDRPIPVDLFPVA